MVFLSTDTSSYCIFTPARVEKQNHSPDHLDARNTLLSWLSLAVYPAGALAPCKFLCKQIILRQSCCTSRPRRALGPWEVKRKRKRMLLRSMPIHWRASLCLSCASPWCHLTARQTPPPTLLPSSSPHWVMRLKAKWLNSKNKVFGALTSFKFPEASQRLLRECTENSMDWLSCALQQRFS